MPETTLQARPAFDGRLPAGRHGRADGPPGVLVSEVDGLALVSVIARRGGEVDLDEAARRSFGCALPQKPQAMRGPWVAFLWHGPGQWLARADGREVPDLMGRLGAAFGNRVALSEQSDGRAVMRIAGPRARDALAKLCGVDLHPRAFGAGDVAATQFAHIVVLMWQVDDTPTYEILAQRSFAGSFAEMVITACAEFGIEIAGPQPA